MSDVPVMIDRRTFYKDLYEVADEVQDEAVRIIKLLEAYGPDHPDLPILENRSSVYVCACTETHCLHWVVKREKASVESIFATKAKLVLVTRLKPRK